VTPTARRSAVGYGQATYQLPQRRACRLARAHRSTIRYVPHPRADEGRVRERLRSLAGRHPRYGYRRLYVLLQREMGAINRKRVYRLYRLEGLKIRRQKRKRVAVNPRVPSQRVWKRGEGWAMDFMLDTLADGRRFPTLNVLDIVTRECLAIEVDTSLPGQGVTRVPESGSRPGRRSTITSDRIAPYSIWPQRSSLTH
jgi:putative transposase